MIIGDPAYVYRPGAVPTYSLYPARSASLFDVQLKVALPVPDDVDAGDCDKVVDGSDEGGAEDCRGADGGGGEETVTVGAII